MSDKILVVCKRCERPHDPAYPHLVSECLDALADDRTRLRARIVELESAPAASSSPGERLDGAGRTFAEALAVMRQHQVGEHDRYTATRLGQWLEALSAFLPEPAAPAPSPGERGALVDDMANALRKGINAWDSGFRPERESAINAMLDALHAWDRRDEPAPAPPPAEGPAPTCGICQRPWNDSPGTVYCGSQHGECGMCHKPRTAGSCKCHLSPVAAAQPEAIACPATPCVKCEGLGAHDSYGNPCPKSDRYAYPCRGCGGTGRRGAPAATKEGAP